MSTRYLEQWERVKRWFKRVESFSIRPSIQKQDDALDDLYAFFTTCFHLKDWINKSRPELGDEVESLFSENGGLPCFIICAGLANASKHMVFDRRRRIYGTASVVGRSVNLFPFSISSNNEENITKRGLASYSWTISSNNMEYDAYELAKKCVEEWDLYLKNKGLI